MNKTTKLIAVLSAAIVCVLAVVPAMADDHGGADWTPGDGAEISGVHYNISTFSVASGTTVYVAPYSGGVNGSVEIHAETINIEGTGILNGDGKGYPGGAGAGHYYHPNGSAWYPGCGTGDGGTHNEVDGAGQHPPGEYPPHEEYKLSSGGGGGYGGEGGLGCSYWTRYTGVGDAAGGDAFGTLDTYQLKIGASGAGGGGGLEEPYKWGGDGGAGGAGILLSAETITITGAINVSGDDGEDGESGYKGCGGGGGGAGGCVLIYTGALSGSGSLNAEGGDGGDAGDGSPSGGHAAGGAGGGAGGRIKIRYSTSTFTGSHSVMNGSGGAHGENAQHGHGLDGYPGEEGTYSYTQQEYCWGTCYDGTACEGEPIGIMNCSECLAESGRVWKPNKDVKCFNTTSPTDLCLDYCPQCCDGVNNNDGDGNIDYPADTECTCGLDPSESEPAPPVPELATIVLFGVGLLALVGYVGYRKKKEE